MGGPARAAPPPPGAAHASLRQPACDLIGGAWLPIPGDRVVSRNPARPADVIWSGAPDAAHVDHAVAASRGALHAWSRWTREKRFAVLRRLRAIYEREATRIADLIRDETGKVMWDAKAEAGALAAKIDITLDATEFGPLRRVTGFDLPLGGSRTGRCWFRPHGVMAVLAPYNFPAHLANGHIIPALAMGNTVILKPSDKTPGVGQLLADLIQEALDAEGAPPGVINLVQGAADIASALARHPGVDGILFTGSWPVGRKILEANLDTPGRIIALEMGGNNAAVVMPDADLKQAAIECVRSAFVTTGQRCTCTRRLVVHKEIAARFIPAVCKVASNLIVGDPRADYPVFMGPMIGEQARAGVLEFQARVARFASARVLLESSALDGGTGGWYLTPGVIEVEQFELASETGGVGADVEVFGPLLRVAVVESLDAAIEQANATRFGLAASIFTKDAGAIDRVLNEARAGCVNVNTGTAGASSKLPFGGLGRSGNHRPAGSFSLDYCAYPVAGMIETGDAATVHPGMRFEDGWLR
ncbi:MAG: aldehyde dehydrogenase family protein [Phycisphaerales bacterium]